VTIKEIIAVYSENHTKYSVIHCEDSWDRECPIGFKWLVILSMGVTIVLTNVRPLDACHGYVRRYTVPRRGQMVKRDGMFHDFTTSCQTSS
jgi:hypothetical protein